MVLGGFLCATVIDFIASMIVGRSLYAEEMSPDVTLFGTDTRALHILSFRCDSPLVYRLTVDSCEVLSYRVCVCVCLYVQALILKWLSHVIFNRF